MQNIFNSIKEKDSTNLALSFKWWSTVSLVAFIFSKSINLEQYSWYPSNSIYQILIELIIGFIFQLPLSKLKKGNIDIDKKLIDTITEKYQLNERVVQFILFIGTISIYFLLRFGLGHYYANK